MPHVATVTIPAASVTLSGFVVTVIPNSAAAWDTFWATVANGGGDIRCYLDDDTTALPREVVSCNTGTNLGKLHIKVGTVSNTLTTDIHIWADGSSSEPAFTDATHGRNAVWSGARRAYTFPASSVVQDSTGGGNDGTNDGVSSLADALGAYGAFVDGESDKITIPNIGQLTDVGISLWFDRDTLATDQRLLTFYRDASANPPGKTDYVLLSTGNKLRLITGEPTGRADVTGSTTIGSGNNSVGVDFASSEISGFVNGSPDIAATSSNVNYFGTSHANSNTTIGAFFFDDIPLESAWFDGKFRQVVIWDSARGGDWYAYEHANQADPPGWYTVTEIASGDATVGHFAAPILLNASFSALLYKTGYFAAPINLAAAFAGLVERQSSFGADISLDVAFQGTVAAAERTGHFEAPILLGSGFEGIVDRRANFAAPITLGASFAATSQRVMSFAADLTLTAGFEAQAGRVAEFAADLVIGAGFAGTPHRVASFSAPIELSASFVADAPNESWTASNFDSSHFITDGPRIKSNILSWYVKATTGIIGQGGFISASTSAGSASNVGSQVIIDEKCYCEFEQVGTVTGNTGSQFGLAPSGYTSPPSLNFFTDVASDGIAYRADGAVKRNNVTLQTYTARVQGDTGMMAFDPDTLKVWFGLNGTWNGDPVAGTGEAATLAAGTYRVMVSNATLAADLYCNFGQKAWEYAPPSGFSGIGDFPI